MMKTALGPAVWLVLTMAVGRAADSPCVLPGSFQYFSFEAARLRTSNLGGLGGRCVDSACTGGATDASTPHELYIENIGVLPTTGQTVDLRITNETEYRAFNVNGNGIKFEEGSTTIGLFGTINLLGPRLATQPKHWDTTQTTVQLRYALVDAWTGEPLVVPRTFFTFYDLDSGKDDTQRECMAIQGAHNVTLAFDTQLEHFAAHSPDNVLSHPPGFTTWDASAYCGSECASPAKIPHQALPRPFHGHDTMQHALNNQCPMI
jgi:hypothetical protein